MCLPRDELKHSVRKVEGVHGTGSHSYRRGCITPCWIAGKIGTRDNCAVSDAHTYMKCGIVCDRLRALITLYLMYIDMILML